MTAGAPFIVGHIVMQALRTAPALAGARLLENSARLSSLQEGAHILLFDDAFDRLRAQPGQVAQRSYGFQITTIRRSAQAREDAHTDWRAIRLLLRTLLPAMQAAGVQIDGSGLQEGEVRYRLENIDAGGACVAGEFTLDYRERH